MQKIIAVKRGIMITQERVKELFCYKDGSLFWRMSRGHMRVGSMAGSPGSGGYLNVRVDNKLYRAHRLIFLYHFGYMSENEVDHIDRNRLNNKIENLREASRSCNSRNSTQQNSTSSGVKGLSWYKAYQKWQAQIKVHGAVKHLGFYSDFTEAVAHRLAAEQCLDWGDCDSSSPAYQFMKDYCGK
jgi:hypothetical protein